MKWRISSMPQIAHRELRRQFIQNKKFPFDLVDKEAFDLKTTNQANKNGFYENYDD